VSQASEPTRTSVQLSARDLTRHFVTRVPGRFVRAKHIVRAVDNVSLDLTAERSRRWSARAVRENRFSHGCWRAS